MSQRPTPPRPPAAAPADAPAARDDGGFLSRWSRRKVQAKDGAAQSTVDESGPRPDPKVALAPTTASPAAPARPATAPAVPAAGQPDAEPVLPTMADVARLTRESDFSAFVGRGVDKTVQRAAMKKLFSDPRYNVMDGLDTYIEDYGKPDPISLATLRKMTPTSAFDYVAEEARKAQEAAARIAGAPQTPSAEPEGVTAGAQAGGASNAPPDGSPQQDVEVDTAADSPQTPSPAHATAPAPGTPLPPQPTASTSVPAPPGEAHAASHDDHTDLQLQPDDAAGRRSPV